MLSVLAVVQKISVSNIAMIILLTENDEAEISCKSSFSHNNLIHGCNWHFEVSSMQAKHFVTQLWLRIVLCISTKLILNMRNCYCVNSHETMIFYGSSFWPPRSLLHDLLASFFTAFQVLLHDFYCTHPCKRRLKTGHSRLLMTLSVLSSFTSSISPYPRPLVYYLLCAFLSFFLATYSVPSYTFGFFLTNSSDCNPPPPVATQSQS